MWFSMANKNCLSPPPPQPPPPSLLRNITYIEFVWKIVKFQIEVGNQMKKAKQ